MELPKIRKSEGGMLDGIKSKLGFANAPSEDGYDDRYYDDYDSDYADDYGDDYAEYADDYGRGYADDYGQGSASKRASQSSSYGSSRHSRPDATSPRLVSIDDVRARTQIPDSLNRDPLPARHVTSASDTASTIRGGRLLVRDSAPNPASPAGVALSERTSAGYNSLFASTTPEPGEDSSAARRTASSADQAPSSATGASSPKTAFDPFEAYSGAGSAGHAPSRSVTILKPAAYGDAERVAKIVRSGDAAVLCLQATPDQLSKRILDFSFGVACYADARVDCIADKVFVIAHAPLTDAERAELKNQGVL